MKYFISCVIFNGVIYFGILVDGFHFSDIQLSTCNIQVDR
ncbi:hypothetical protein Xbed_02909 [Xenorhabdus beddingii]|uniref:Uncharacterized protein n=1 Tax=Xenorhabdus beddingii TaxID=40578 RepID=A0A1Y2SJ73_9GAMM|nr:hypothetical protein Xbed_02909 [Xenorhabdus beddingii]